MNTAVLASQTPAEWLHRLTENNVLRWRHGTTNTGLLLAPLLEITGWQGDVLSLTDALPVSDKQIMISDLLTVMGALGYRISSEHRSTQSIRKEDLPALFVPDNSEGWRAGIVLREMSTYGLLWEDGREQYRGALPEGKGTLYRFERLLTQDENLNERKDWLKDISLRFRPVFRHAAMLSLLMHVFTLAMPLFSMAVYDRVIGAHAGGTLPMLAVGVIMALLTEAGIRWMRVRLAGWMGARSGVLVSAAMFERLLFLPASVIEQASVSSQLARIRAFEAVRDFITGSMFLSLLEMPFVLVLILMIALLAGPVALISIGIIGVYGLLLYILRPRWQQLGKEAAHTAAERQQMMMEAIENLKPIYAAGISERIIERFKTLSWRASRAQHQFALTASFVQHVASFLTVVAGVTTIGWCLERIWMGEMTAGAMVATMIITWRVLYPLQALCVILPHFEQIRASAKQVGQLMSLQPEAHAAKHALAERTLEGTISFQNISLRYSRKSDPVFLGLNMDIPKGQIIAIYGGNGTGKSSILRLVMGLYAPAMGTIRLDGVDHRQFDPRVLRRQIAYLPQAPELLPGTVAENLRVSEPLAEDYRLRQALLWADAWEMVEELPAGLNTMLGEGGVIPSSGLAARLCLARLYLSERPIILCDELPAQILNTTTGERFRRFLTECRGTRTVLFVTHREDWLPVADRVIWMKPDGRPVIGKPAAGESLITREES